MALDVETILREGVAGYRDFVNPLVTLRAKLLAEPSEALRTQAGQLTDGDRLIEDFHGTQSFGHRHPAITQAIREFLDSDAANWFPSRVNPWAGELAKRICERANQTNEGPRSAYDNVFFANSGSGAVEAALKIARAATGKPRVLSMLGAYHGTTMGSCALMNPGMFRDLFEPHLPAAGPIAFGDIDALAEAMSGGDVAALIVEPIQLEGGVNALPSAFIEAACELTEKHGALLVADEIQTGLGRTGRFLASECWPRRPDAIVLGKHLGGGLLPISGMVSSRELFERAYGQHYATAEAHNSTFSGNAMVCVAALATLDLLTDELIATIGQRGDAFSAELGARLKRHALFEGMRGKGQLIGIRLRPADHPWLSFEHFGVEGLGDTPSIGVILCHRLYKRGYYCFVCGHDWKTIRILPRFNVPSATLASFADAIDEELEKLCDLI